MNNINFTFPVSRGELQYYPFDQSLQFKHIPNETIMNNFHLLYNKIAQAERDLQFLDFIHVVGTFSTTADGITKSHKLLPGEALGAVSKTGENIILFNDSYHTGDYILKMPDQSYQHISGFQPLGFLPFYTEPALGPGELQLWYYDGATNDATITVDYTGSTTTKYTKKEANGDSTSLSGFENGHFYENSTTPITTLAKEYIFKYNAATTVDHYSSLQLTSPTYSNSTKVNSGSGIVKLYSFTPHSNNTRDNINQYDVEEIQNGLNIDYEESTSDGNTTCKLTVSLVADLIKYAKANSNIQWWVEVK